MENYKNLKTSGVGAQVSKRGTLNLTGVQGWGYI
jgi:hypothetical protein